MNKMVEGERGWVDDGGSEEEEIVEGERGGDDGGESGGEDGRCKVKRGIW